MPTTDLHYLGLVEVGKQVQAKKLSPVEVTRAMLERIERLDGKLKSYACVMADQALAEAAAAEKEIAAGKVKGPLHGVPVAIKDLCWVKGAPAAHGMTIHHDFRPSEDATVVARLKEAGAIILGKLQQTEGAYADHHPKIDPPKNPWNADLWPGASSSGSGSATAAGLCFGSLGTDTGRFSSSKPNLQNITRGELRKVFVSSGPDRRLIVADYSQIELRIAALIAEDDVIDADWNRDGTDLAVARRVGNQFRLEYPPQAPPSRGRCSSTQSRRLSRAHFQPSGILADWSPQAL